MSQINYCLLVPYAPYGSALQSPVYRTPHLLEQRRKRVAAMLPLTTMLLLMPLQLMAMSTVMPLVLLVILTLQLAANDGRLRDSILILILLLRVPINH